MSGPRMGNMGAINGNRRPNLSRLNYHENRQNSYQDHRQSYSDHINRQSHENNRAHSSHSDYRQSSSSSNAYQMLQNNSGALIPTHSTHHDELIKYIYESWSKVEMDKGTNNIMYYQETENHHLKDFRPFNLEAFWGRKMHQNHHQQQQQQQHHS